MGYDKGDFQECLDKISKTMMHYAAFLPLFLHFSREKSPEHTR